MFSSGAQGPLLSSFRLLGELISCDNGSEVPISLLSSLGPPSGPATWPSHFMAAPSQQENLSSLLRWTLIESNLNIGVKSHSIHGSHPHSKGEVYTGQGSWGHLHLPRILLILYCAVEIMFLSWTLVIASPAVQIALLSSHSSACLKCPVLLCLSVHGLAISEQHTSPLEWVVLDVSFTLACSLSEYCWGGSSE